MRRLAAFLVVGIAALGFFGTRAMLDDGGDTTAVVRRDAPAQRIAALEQDVADRPEDVAALNALAAGYLQRVRETGDASFYALADGAAARALAVDPDEPNALVTAGAIANSKHDFTSALILGQRAHQIEPTLVAPYAVIVDALVELGRYDEAIVAAQEMADLRPDFAALSRVSYLRELHGDLDGAIEAMRQAIEAGTGVEEDRVWGLLIVGNLNLTRGDIDAASLAYEEAAAIAPGDPMSEFGLARLAIARRDYPLAERHLRAAIDQRPLPEYLIVLGDLLTSQGRTAEAEEQYATVRAIQRLNAANGLDVDLELALFDADTGHDPQGTYETARAAYDRRPGIYAADTAAWAAYKSGRIDEARTLMTQALRLGTKDPRLEYHAGVIAGAAGDLATAQEHFDSAAAMEAGQSSVLYVEDVRTRLEEVRAVYP
jgi:tetratricopeptide (TPR) repeat protein